MNAELTSLSAVFQTPCPISADICPSDQLGSVKNRQKYLLKTSKSILIICKLPVGFIQQFFQQ